MAAVKGRARRAQRARASSHRFPLLLAACAVAALAIVGGLIVVQAATNDGTKIPARVATGEGRVLGAAAAPVTIIEYADFQCPVCKRAEASIISRIEREYVVSGRVKIEFRMFPFLGQESFDAAQAAEAARDQGKFWEYHDALFNTQGAENGGAFSYERLVALAAQVGLDVPLFERTLSGNVHLAAIQREADEARAAGVTSTPTFYVGDERIVGAQPYATFQAAIDAALASAAQQ